MASCVRAEGEVHHPAFRELLVKSSEGGVWLLGAEGADRDRAADAYRAPAVCGCSIAEPRAVS